LGGLQSLDLTERFRSETRKSRNVKTTFGLAMSISLTWLFILVEAFQARHWGRLPCPVSWLPTLNDDKNLGMKPAVLRFDEHANRPHKSR
jgi:hypothetical protein